MNPITSLKPSIIWNYFDEICLVPRPSKKEDQMIEYLLKFAEEHQLKVKKDDVGNVLILKKGNIKESSLSPVILQSHLDMVGEKNNNIDHDFAKDPIKVKIEGDWVKAEGTTLGADNGIGIATQLAILASDDIEHGPIECLFTVDEETGMTGAKALKKGFITGKKLINLDSEDEGELFIGCAGGIDSVSVLDVDWESVPRNAFAFKVSVTGLTGGHSGDDIHLGRANANKVLVQFLNKFSELIDFHISAIDGGNLRNAIAREASAICVIHTSYKEKLRVEFNILAHEIEQQFENTDPEMLLSLQSTELTSRIIKKDLQQKLLKALEDCPHGVIEMSKTVPGLVQTSTNLASIKILDDKITIVSSHRSSVESERDRIALKVKKIFNKAGAKVTLSDGYPGWEPNLDSELLKKSVSLYEKLFNETPKVRAIHAGVECGLFLTKYPDLDMISFGPTIKGAHSPDERLHIPSVMKFWKFLIVLLHDLS